MKMYVNVVDLENYKPQIIVW